MGWGLGWPEGLPAFSKSYGINRMISRYRDKKGGRKIAEEIKTFYNGVWSCSTDSGLWKRSGK